MFDLTTLVAVVPQLLEVVDEERHIGLAIESAASVDEPRRLKIFNALVLDQRRKGLYMAGSSTTAE